MVIVSKAQTAFGLPLRERERRRPAPQVSIDCDGSVHWDGKCSAPDVETHKHTRSLVLLMRCPGLLLVPYAASSIDLKLKDRV